MRKTLPIIFVHIPKTGGSALTVYINQQHSAEEVYFVTSNKRHVDKDRIGKVKCVFGHNRYGHHPELGPRQYFTVLREPVSRVISHYSYFKYVLKNHFAKLSLQEFAKMNLFSNMQTQYITGEQVNLEQAIVNLKEFAFFGLTEQFPETLFLMRKTFHWSDDRYIVENVNPKKDSNIDNKTIEIIKEANQVDIQLYEWAKVQFATRLRNLDTNTQKELKIWKKKHGLG